MTQTELARELELERASMAGLLIAWKNLIGGKTQREERQARLAGSFTPCRDRATSKMRVEADACMLACSGDLFCGTGALSRIAGQDATIWAASHNH